MEDNEIIQLYWARDQMAIEHTARKYGSYCRAIAKNILGNAEDAEECVNDTYMSAWSAIPPQRPKLLSAFIVKITRNISFNKYRMKRADKRGGGEIPAILDELSECVSGSDNIEEKIEYKELVKAVNDFLGTLSSDKRNIFVRRYWYSDSVANIAKRYEMKENAVSMLLGRLRIKLREYITARGFDI